VPKQPLIGLVESEDGDTRPKHKERDNRIGQYNCANEEGKEVTYEDVLDADAVDNEYEEGEDEEYGKQDEGEEYEDCPGIGCGLAFDLYIVGHGVICNKSAGA
jgi:hypothetical protein